MHMSIRPISLDAPNFNELEAAYLKKATEEGFVSTFGPFTQEFEQKIAGFTGAEAACSAQSGTASLHLSLYSLGIGRGDEVLVPAVTFAATANAIKHVDATPVLVDVDSKTWNMSLDDLKQKINTKSKAIIPVHLYGNPAPIREIMEIAQQAKLHVVEDAAESLGSYVGSTHTGLFGTFGCLSFNGNKVITTGGGGMILGAQSNIEKVRILANQGRDPERSWFHQEVGFNYRMTNLEAALGLAQFQKLEHFLQKKKGIHLTYQKYFKDDERVSFQEELKDAKSAHWMTCLRFSERYSVLNIAKKLESAQIPTRRLFAPLSEFPPFQAHSNSLPNAYKLHDSVLCFPSSTLNELSQIEYVCEVLKSILDSNQ